MIKKRWGFLLLLVYALFLHFLLAISPLFSQLSLSLPSLIYSYYSLTFSQSLSYALCLGAWIDLFSLTHPGLYSFLYFLTTYFLYPQKRYLFPDRFSMLPLFTFLFSALSSLLLFLSAFLSCDCPTFSFSAFLSDCVLFPLFEGASFAFFFTFPLSLFSWRLKKAV